MVPTNTNNSKSHADHHDDVNDGRLMTRTYSMIDTDVMFAECGGDDFEIHFIKGSTSFTHHIRWQKHSMPDISLSDDIIDNVLIK